MNSPANDVAQRRFRPRLLPTFATIVAIAVFVAAGQWQYRRMELKQSLRMQFDAASAAAPARSLPDHADWATWRYRPVTITGTFDAARQILIDNKIDAGRAGYHVVTPFLLGDGRAVLVDRGWIPIGESRTQLPVIPPPGGTLAVQGRINLPTPNYVELAANARTGVVWENLDPARFAAATGLPVLPVVIEQTVATRSDDDLVRNWPAPDFGIDRHLIYMVQWYLFAATAAGLWLYFNLRPARPETLP